MSLSNNSFRFNDLQCIRGELELFNSLDAHIISGQCLHVVGANGSGKTSLLRILCGLSSPDHGTLHWNNAPVDEKYFARSVYLGHKDALKNELSAIENLRFHQQIMGEEHDENALDDCLNQMQLLNCADLIAQKLSFGQRRRLAFAKLLLQPSDLWILDEPFTGIDKDGRLLIENLCLEQLKCGGMIILTHHQSLCDSVLVDYISQLSLTELSDHNSALT